MGTEIRVYLVYTLYTIQSDPGDRKRNTRKKNKKPEGLTLRILHVPDLASCQNYERRILIDDIEL